MHAFFLQGLTTSGYLLAVGDDGQMCELHPDGNRYVIIDFVSSNVDKLLTPWYR